MGVVRTTTTQGLAERIAPACQEESMSRRSFATSALALATAAGLLAACQTGLSVSSLTGKDSDPRPAESDEGTGADDRSDSPTGTRREPDPAAARALDACFARLIRDPSLTRGECKKEHEAYYRGRPIRDSDIIGAAKALFGEGLDVNTSGDSMTVSDGSLDRKTLARYAREMYVPALIEDDATAIGVFRHRQFSEGEAEKYKKLNSERKWGYLLTEPTSRLLLCHWLAGAVNDQEKGAELKSWCYDAGLRAARLPVYLYQPGRPRTVRSGAPQDEFPLDGQTYVPRSDGSGWNVQVAVSGTTPLDGYAIERSVDFIGQVLGWEDSDPELKKKGKQLRQEFKELNAKRRAAAHAPMAKTIGSKGKLVWTDIPFADPWKPFPVAKSALPACESLYLAAWAPTTSDDDVLGWHLYVSADGEECFDDDFDVPPGQQTGTPEYMTKLAESCKLEKGGKHKVTTTLRQRVRYNTGEKRARISDDSVEVYEVGGSRPDKVLTRNSITCTN
jgi:hypothetical protein